MLGFGVAIIGAYILAKKLVCIVVEDVYEKSENNPAVSVADMEQAALD
jgi:hypothetical protein